MQEHLQEGDLVIASQPYLVNQWLGRRRVDFWLESKLVLPATLDDRRSLPLDRRDGTAQVWSARGLQDLFARHQRIWLVSESIPASNEPEVTTYLRQEMDVVYESYRTALFLRDNKDRTALHRLRDQRALERSR